MSNPDFPGPSWQDSSSSAEVEPYGRGPADRAVSYGRTPDYPGRSSYDASDAANGRGYRGSADGGYQGYDARRGSNGGNGHGRADQGHGRSAANGDGDADGYGRSGSGRYALDRGRGDGAGGGHRRSGYAGEDAYGNGRGDRASYSNGRGDYDTYGGGNGRGDYDTYGGNGRGDYGRGDYGRGGYRRGADEYTVGVTDEELYRPDRPDDTDDRGTRGRGPRRGARGYADSDDRPARPSGNWLQRQWHARWWRHWTIKKAALLVGGIAAGMALILIAGFFYLYSTIQVPLQTLSQPLIQSSEVYFAGGKVPVGCFCSQDRTVLSPAQLARDKYLEPAFFAAEDRRFLTEGGISITGTARALLVDLSGSGEQGGSTITEQLVKTALLPSGIGNLTLKQKLEEIIIAIKLANKESKTWILTHYLNQINLGWGAYGVEAAAEHYFGKHAWQLSIPQCAMLAAMVQYPSFNPADPAQVVAYLGYSLLSRWVSVLGNMARPAADTVGITQQQLDAILPVPNPTTTSQLMQDLKNFPKIIPPSKSSGSWGGWRGYIMDDVMSELESDYGLKKQEIYSDGLQIVTTISEAKMNALYAAVKQAKQMMGGLPWYAHIGALLENPNNGAIEAVYEGPNSNPNWKECARLRCQYPMATVARNQVGSSFKPYVLAGAVQEGMNVKTSILNGYSPICVPPETMPMTESRRGSPTNCPPEWLGVDYDPVVEGPVSVSKAAALSSNAAFEDLTHRVGTSPIIRLAQNFGVNISPAPEGSGLTDDVGKIGIALGIAPLTVEEQTNTFATLADNGIYHTPHMIASITQNGQPVAPKVFTHQVLTPAQTADVDWALSFDTVYGTAYPNAVLSPARPTIAKTGTTNVAQSAFFIGALPKQYSFGVGMFTNSQNNVSGGQTLDALPSIGGAGGGYGGGWPATLWRLYMTKLIAMTNLPVNQLAPLNLTGFQKWVQVKPAPQKKCQPGQPWFGGGGFGGGPGGPGNGHGHGPGQKQCKGGQSPSPSPSPSPSGSPSPSPSPSGGPSPSPSPSFSVPFGANPATEPDPQPTQTPSPQPRSTVASLTAAVLQRQPAWRPLRAPVATGRR